MKRLILIGAAMAVVLTACGGSDVVAAYVNDDPINSGQVDQLLGADVEPTPELVARSLTTLIQWKATEQAAAEQFDFSPTEEEIDTEVANVVAQAGAESLDEIAESQNIPVDLLRRYIVQLMTRDAVALAIEETVPEPTDDEVATQLTDFPQDWTSVCGSHLLVDTEAEAEAALLRITSGEDFATVAAAVSKDTQSAIQGGDFGCSTASGFVGPFADAVMEAPLDTVTGPVETEFGFHVIIVTDREEATVDDVRSELIRQSVVEASDAWFLDVLEKASVDIAEPTYGVWTLDPEPQVVAPVVVTGE